MPKDLATIPADLRARKDLSIADIERIVYLRSRHKTLLGQLDSAESRVKQIKADLVSAAQEETDLLAAD